MTEWAELTRAEDGSWLCSATGCTEPAALQIAVPDEDGERPVMACTAHVPDLPEA